MGDPMTDLEAAKAFTNDNKHRPYHFHAPLNIDWRDHKGRLQCCASGPYDRSGRGRCGNNAKVTTADGYHWCHIHSPEGVDRRDRAQADKYTAERAKAQAVADAMSERKFRADNFPALEQALKDIAAGHNDAMALARATLDALEGARK